MTDISQRGKLSEASSKIVEWVIDDYFTQDCKDLSFGSPYFYLSNYKFYINLYPEGDYGESEDFLGKFLSLYLILESENSPNVVKGTFGIKSVNNEVSNARTFTWYPKKDEAGWGFKSFLEISELLNRKTLLVPLDSLTIMCSLNVENSAQDVYGRMDKLIKNVKDMFISEKIADVSIIVQEETFSAHRFILAARSPVLAAMFENDMIEKKTGVINIRDCDPKAFHHFLHYLYSGEVDYETCDFIDLYKIADKYDVTDLKLLCIDCIDLQLSAENFHQTYLFGQLVNEVELLTRLQKYFNEHFETIVSSGRLYAMMKENCELANELILRMTKNKKEE